MSNDYKYCTIRTMEGPFFRLRIGNDYSVERMFQLFELYKPKTNPVIVEMVNEGYLSIDEKYYLKEYAYAKLSALIGNTFHHLDNDEKSELKYCAAILNVDISYPTH